MHALSVLSRHSSIGCCLLWLAGAVLGFAPTAAAAGSDDIVLYPSDVTRMNGAWSRAASADGAGGQVMTSPERRFTAVRPLENPKHFFEVSFDAKANTSYHVWLRLRSAGNASTNDSVWVQFSDALNQSDAPLWRIGTASALLVNLESCDGCGMSGWGWQDGAWWTDDDAIVRFPSSGTRTLRVQTREDGVEIDQIVLSPASYFSASPGTLLNDTTIVSKTDMTLASRAGAPEIVLYATDATRRVGNWTLQSDATAAQGKRNASADEGWQNTTSRPLRKPQDYLEWTFDAVAGQPYRVWLRMSAANNAAGNDSVWIQFSNSLRRDGRSRWRIGGHSGIVVALENCEGCGVSGWGWQDRSWWTNPTDVYFASTGRSTIRIQTREDGVRIDQVVLSPSRFLTSPPGALKNDDTLVYPDGATGPVSGGSGGSGDAPLTVKYLAFTASADHATLVSHYVLDIFREGANPSTATPVSSASVGKPAPVGGEVTVDIASTLQPLPLGTYFATLTAVGNGGESRSAPSNTFTR